MSVRGSEDQPSASGRDREGSETRRGSPAPSDLLRLLMDSFGSSQRSPPHLELLTPSPAEDAPQEAFQGACCGKGAF